MSGADADVVIVGAGPAGCATALSLVQRHPELARRAMVLDRATFPRDKVCGGGLSATSRAWLDRLGVHVDVPGVVAGDLRVVFDGFEREHRWRRPAIVVRRFDFDHLLVKAVRQRGVPVAEGTAVTDVSADPDGVTVTLAGGDRLRAKAVVAADGMRSKVARQLWASHGDRRPTARLLQGDVPGHADPRLVFDFSELGSGWSGYVWVFPTVKDGRPTSNVGIFEAPRDGVPGDAPRAALDRVLARHALAVDDVASWSEWQFDPRFAFASPRILTVGDAAGIDGLFGEGIAQALAYGWHAADALGQAARTGDWSFAGYRRRIRVSRLGAELAFLRGAAAALYGPHGARVARQARRPGLGNVGMRLLSWPFDGAV